LIDINNFLHLTKR